MRCEYRRVQINEERYSCDHCVLTDKQCGHKDRPDCEDEGKSYIFILNEPKTDKE